MQHDGSRITCKVLSGIIHRTGETSLVAQMVRNLPARQETRVRALVGKIPGEENGNPLQYSCLGNPMDRGAWQDTVHGIAKN